MTWKGKLLLVAISATLAWLAAEVVLWTFLPFPHPYAAQGAEGQRVFDATRRSLRNRYVPSHHVPATLELSPDPDILPGASKTARLSINAFGFRNQRMQSIEKPPGEVRVFAVGGSTTECFYLDDAETWPESLQRKLAVKRHGINVINAGHSGDNTRDHIALLAQRIIPFRPDYVLLLAGVNDLSLHLDPGYSPIRADRRSLIVEEPPRLSTLLGARLAEVSQVARLAILAGRGRIGADARGNPVQDAKGEWVRRARTRLQQLPPRTVDTARMPGKEYEENVRTLIGVARAAGASPVLITQPALWGAPPGKWEELLWVSYDGRIPHAQLWEMLERFNDVMRRLSAELGVPLVDLARRLPKTAEVFYDDDHFTVKGAEIVADEIARVMFGIL